MRRRRSRRGAITSSAAPDCRHGSTNASRQGKSARRRRRRAHYRRTDRRHRLPAWPITWPDQGPDETGQRELRTACGAVCQAPSCRLRTTRFGFDPVQCDATTGVPERSSHRDRRSCHARHRWRQAAALLPERRNRSGVGVLRIPRCAHRRSFRPRCARCRVRRWTSIQPATSC